MSYKILAAIILAAWTAGVMQTARAEQAAPTGGVMPTARAEQAAATGGSTWTGIYSETQAKLGAETYAKHCSECHLEDLAGDGFAPALKGPEFMSNWNGLTVADLFDRIKVSMPPANPNSVTPKEKADIVAHILKQSAFPAGKTDLPMTLDALKVLKFEATKPGNN
ncbi:MAG TPA: cytochrome c [Vicinamibacterales bacterium]|nr:cytochrome c [Vicinamibacterales bacterium]